MPATLRVVTSSTGTMQVVSRDKEAEEALIPVRLAVYKHDPHELARQCDCSYATIMSFRSGRTVWPRPKTLFAILQAVGATIKFEFRNGN